MNPSGASRSSLTLKLLSFGACPGPGASTSPLRTSPPSARAMDRKSISTIIVASLNERRAAASLLLYRRLARLDQNGIASPVSSCNEGGAISLGALPPPYHLTI